MINQLIHRIKIEEKISLFQLVSLFLGLLFLPINFQWFEIFFAFGIFFQIVLIWKKKALDIELDSIDILIVLYTLWSLLSLLYSEKGSVSLFFQNCLIPVAFYFQISRYKQKEDESLTLLKAFWLGATLVTILVFFEFFRGESILKEDWVDISKFPLLMNRVSGPLENPNLLAGYLCLVISFWSGYRLYRPKQRDGLIGSGGLFVLLICLLLTYSRGAWISLFCILIILGAWGKRGKYLLFGVVSLVGLILLNEPSIAERINSVFQPLSESSSAMRLAIWDSTLYLIADHPALGIGWGAFPEIYPYYDYFLIKDTIIYHAHNLYLQIAAETGIIGLILWWGVIVEVYRKLWCKVRCGNALALGIYCSIGVVLLGGLTDDWLFNPKMATLFYFLVGIAKNEIDTNNGQEFDCSSSNNNKNRL